MDSTQNTPGKENPFLSRRQAIAAVAAMSASAAMPALANHSFNRQEERMDTSALFPSPVYSLNRSGNSRQFTTFDPKTKNKAYPIQPGEKKILVNYEGAGIITRLWMTFSGWFWMHWEPGTYTDPTILKKADTAYLLGW